MTKPNTNSPNTSTRQPLYPSNLTSSPLSTGATIRHGLAFPQALSPNIFHSPPSRLKTTLIKSKRIFVPLTLNTISLATSTQSKNSAPTTFSPPSSTSTPLLQNHNPTKQDYSRSSLHAGINIYLFFVTTTPTPSTPTFSKIGKPWISLYTGQRATNIYVIMVQLPLSTSLITSAPTKCKNSSANTTLTSNLSSRTPTAATPPNV